MSVLIPCWNAAASIEATLASILAERSVPLECIVVDDGSTDGTGAMLEAVAQRDGRVVPILLAENEGVSNARNRGLEQVRADWLTLVDADDRLMPGAIATLVEAARRTDALAVVGQQVWSDGHRTWLSPLYDIPDIREPGRKSLVTHPGLLYYVSPHAKLLHRSCFEGLSFFGRVLGDQPWTIRALLRAGTRIEVLDETVYEWRRVAGDARGGSITATARSSARRTVEAVEVAGRAFAEVGAEARRLLAEDDARIVESAYADRLMRSDIGYYIRGAIARRDPTLNELLAATERFLGSLPRDAIGGSGALTPTILEPPLLRWHRLDRPARTAYWSLLDAALALQPDAPTGAASVAGRLALRLAARTRSRRVRSTVAWLATVGGTPARALRRLARVVRAGSRRLLRGRGR